MKKLGDEKSVDDKKETPWHARLLITGFLFLFTLGFPILIYRLGNFMYSEDFFWQSDARIYLIIALVFLYVVAVFAFLFKMDSLIHDKKSNPSPTGLNTSVRYLLTHNKIKDTEYYDENASPTKIKEYMDEIVERER